jgi:hypothetical protein
MLNGGPHIDEYGIQRWYLNGKRHREDGPAVECADGDKYWYFEDELHREGAPAVETVSGYRLWYHHGKLHREDGPAEEYASDNISWYLNDRFLGVNDVGFWAHWEQLTHVQRCNLNLHKWLAKYT